MSFKKNFIEDSFNNDCIVREYIIRKKDKVRLICSYNEELKSLARKINSKIVLKNLDKVSFLHYTRIMHIIDGYLKNNKQILVLDIADYFESVILEKLYKILDNKDLVEDIKKVYSIPSEHVGTGKIFKRISGLRTGCPLSIKLSNIYINDFLSKINRDSIIEILVYVDDIIIVTEKDVDLVNITLDIILGLKDYGLRLNIDKIKTSINNKISLFGLELGD